MAGKTWTQSTPPPAGTTYEWVGTPHASASIKRVDGVEVARNELSNPSFELGVDGVSSSGTASFSQVNGANIGAIGDYAMAVELVDANASGGWVMQSYNVEPSTSTRWVGLSTVARSSYMMFSGVRHYIQMRQNGVSISQEYLNEQTGMESNGLSDQPRLCSVMEVPPNTDEVRVWLRPNAAAELGRYHTDAWMSSLGSTRAEALAQVEEYFDGSFEDDREGDVWVDPSTGAFHSWGGASRGWVSRDDDKANHPLSDNRLDRSGVVNPVHGSGTAPHSIRMGAGDWSHPDGDEARAYMDIWSQTEYPYVDPAIRLVLTGGTVKLTDGLASVAVLGPDPGGRWSEGAPDPHFMRVEPGEELEFRCRLNYSWSDTVMFRDKGVVARVTFYDAGGSWVASRYSPPVPAEGIRALGAPLNLPVTVPDGARFASVIIYIDAPAQTRTGHGSLYFTDLYFGTTNPARSGASEVGVATVARRGLVSETFARSREKISLQLAEPDAELLGGERVELAAFAASSSEVTWRWRQITGPEVFLIREGNTCHFQAPDVSTETDMRIAVSASSVDGANRSDWHFFDLEILPTVGRFAAPGGDFEPYTPQMVGYDRGKREIWNDVIAPVGMDPEGRKEPKLVDLGIPADDVTFSLDGEEPARASAGAVYVDIRDGAIYRNFGGGYNETDDTTGAPRRNAYMVNPATGEVFEWIEEADDGR